MQEADLASRLAADLDGCFEELVFAFQNRLYAFAFRLDGNSNDAEEITQDAFVRAYRALKTYPPERVQTLSLKPWLYQILINTFRNHVRRKRVAQTRLDHGLEVADDERLRPEAMLAQSERSAELARALSSLPVRFRAAVVLRHVQGLSYVEVAEILNQPVGTVKANVHRGVRSLRETMNEQMRKAG